MNRPALLPKLKARLSALQKKRPKGGSSPTRDALVRHARATLHDIVERAAASTPEPAREREPPIVDPPRAPAGKRGLVTRLARSEHRQTALLLLAYAASRLSQHQTAKEESQRPAPPERPAPNLSPLRWPRSRTKLSDLSARRWRDTFKRTLAEFRDDDLTDWAAALTYYAVLSLFPTVIVLIAILGLAGQYPQTSDALLTIIGRVGPASAVDTFREPIEGVVKAKGGAGLLLGFGLVGAIWSASGYFGAFFRAANVVYETREGRRFWKLRPLQILVTIGMTLLLALVGIAIVTTGPLAQAVGDAIGLGSTTVTVWNWAKWPAASRHRLRDDRRALLRGAQRQAAGSALDHARAAPSRS